MPKNALLFVKQLLAKIAECWGIHP